MTARRRFACISRPSTTERAVICAANALRVPEDHRRGPSPYAQRTMTLSCYRIAINRPIAARRQLVSNSLPLDDRLGMSMVRGNTNVFARIDYSTMPDSLLCILDSGYFDVRRVRRDASSESTCG